MATSSVVHSLPTNSCVLLEAPNTTSIHNPSSARFPSLSPVGLGYFARCLSEKGTRGGPLKAAKTGGIEPDLPESNEEDTRTAGEDEEDSFPYGYADGHHTFHKKDAQVDVWEAFKEVFVDAGGPRGFQAYLAWGTLPLLYVMVGYGVQVEYIFLGMVLFIFAFIGIEMAKPEEDYDFPPEIYKERRKKRFSQTTNEIAPTSAPSKL
eukprot:c29330_g1_i1 orf=200-820(+)